MALYVLKYNLGRQGSARTGHQHEDAETAMNSGIFGLGLNLDRTNKTVGSSDRQENAIQLKTCFHFSENIISEVSTIQFHKMYKNKLRFLTKNCRHVQCPSLYQFHVIHETQTQKANVQNIIIM
jgi:hypothetical protein